MFSATSSRDRIIRANCSPPATMARLWSPPRRGLGESLDGRPIPDDPWAAVPADIHPAGRRALLGMARGGPMTDYTTGDHFWNIR